jgi:tetratricopeptide (TPR) repeat protein
VESQRSGRESGGLKHQLSLVGKIVGIALSVVLLLNGLRDFLAGGTGITVLLLAILAAALLVVVGLYLVLPKREEEARVLAASGVAEGVPRRVPRYPRGRKLGMLLLCLVGVSLVAAATTALLRRYSPPKTAIILIARFYGPEERYGVRDQLLARLRRDLAPVAGVELRPLRESITEENGPDCARAMGRRCKAAIVVWGGYTATGSSVSLALHHEVLSPAPEVSLPGGLEPDVERRAPLSELEDFTLHGDVVNDVELFCLTSLGMTYYASKKWDKAVEALSAAADAAVRMPDTVRSALMLFLGNSLKAALKLEPAIGAYTSAIRLDSGNAPALNNLGMLHFSAARFDSALPLLRQARAIDEKKFGPKHPRVATDLNNLALVLSDINRPSEAERLYRQAYTIDSTSFGPNHPEVATDLNNLAQLLQATNRLDEAESLMRRALAIDSKSYGSDHPRVATDLHNLAELLRAKNRLREAEPMIRRALAIDEKSFGPDHQRVAPHLSSLAQLLKARNRLAEAEPLMRRALAIDEKSFGSDHPRVATELNNLAMLYRASNRLAEAEPLMRRAVAIDSASYGPEHPSFARHLNNLAQLLEATGRATEAEPLYRRSLAIDSKSCGSGHPSVARDLNNLAALLEAAHRYGEAEPLMRWALAIDSASYGLVHPSVARDLNNLAQLFQATNRMTQAESLMRRQLGILLKCTQANGYTHPDVQAAFANYAGLLRAMGRSEDDVRLVLSELAAQYGFKLN